MPFTSEFIKNNRNYFIFSRKQHNAKAAKVIPNPVMIMSVAV
jgi:hypothetical protein